MLNIDNFIKEELINYIDFLYYYHDCWYFYLKKIIELYMKKIILAIVLSLSTQILHANNNLKDVVYDDFEIFLLKGNPLRFPKLITNDNGKKRTVFRTSYNFYYDNFRYIRLACFNNVIPEKDLSLMQNLVDLATAVQIKIAQEHIYDINYTRTAVAFGLVELKFDKKTTEELGLPKDYADDWVMLEMFFNNDSLDNECHWNNSL